MILREGYHNGTNACDYRHARRHHRRLSTNF